MPLTTTANFFIESSSQKFLYIGSFQNLAHGNDLFVDHQSRHTHHTIFHDFFHVSNVLYFKRQVKLFDRFFCGFIERMAALAAGAENLDAADTVYCFTAASVDHFRCFVGGATAAASAGGSLAFFFFLTVIDAVKAGAIKHFFLVAGCDGSRPGRNYYTEFVKQTPKDTVVLTLACGKYRFNDLDLGAIGGLPRLLDIGQCNDAYSAIQIAVALAEAFGCCVNDLPLSMVLSWYEQKAVCILLTLLHLGIKNIRLGPTLPAFVSPNVLNFLVEKFNIAPISTPEADLQAILGR